ncbi:MAG: glycosyl hydrolase [Candidatus Phosphoribacter sp.]
MANDWTIAVYDDFPGTLVFGVGLLPKDRNGTLAQVAAGDFDATWQAIGDNLNRHRRQRSIVRIGLEANGTWFPWGATADTAEDFKAAFRRVAEILKGRSRGVIINFDITCGVGLEGASDKLAPLTRLYPGDDVTDVIGCDYFDAESLDLSKGPDVLGATGNGPSMNDVLAFARERGKPMSVPEWGLDAVLGAGDRPEFIATMYDFFDKNAADLVFENYFNEHGTTLRSSLFQEVQNPQSAQTYVALWRSERPQGDDSGGTAVPPSQGSRSPPSPKSGVHGDAASPVGLGLVAVA